MIRRTTLVEDGFNFSRFGCFTRPLTHEEIVRMPSAAGFLELQEVYYNLCGGDFSGVPKLLRIVQDQERNSFDVTSAATDLIGYVGTVDTFRSMRSDVESLLALPSRNTPDWPADQLRSYVRAFENWGRIDVVPFLLEIYLQLHGGLFELGYIPLTISNLLASNEDSLIWDEPPTRHLENYLNLVMNEYDAVVERIGSDKEIVWNGKLRSIPTIARRIRSLGHEQPRAYWRGRLRKLRSMFEPATGIDCSEMFDDDERALPLQAASIAESFFEGTACQSYIDGVRTFFGHRVR